MSTHSDQITSFANYVREVEKDPEAKAALDAERKRLRELPLVTLHATQGMVPVPVSEWRRLTAPVTILPVRRSGAGSMIRRFLYPSGIPRFMPVQRLDYWWYRWYSWRDRRNPRRKAWRR